MKPIFPKPQEPMPGLVLIGSPGHKTQQKLLSKSLGKDINLKNLFHVFESYVYTGAGDELAKNKQQE